MYILLMSRYSRFDDLKKYTMVYFTIYTTPGHNYSTLVQ